MQYSPQELAARLDVLSQNVLAVEAYLVQITAAVADTKRQLEELRTASPGRGAFYGAGSACPITTPSAPEVG